MKAVNQFAFRLARPVVFVLAVLMTAVGVYNVLALGRLVVRNPGLILPEKLVWTEALLQSVLGEMGLAPGFYAYYVLAITALFSLTFLACAWLILLRRSQDWFGLYLTLLLLAWGMAGAGVFSDIPRAIPWMQPIESYVSWLMWPGLFLLFYFFPSGHVIPRWTRWFALSLGLFILYGMIITYFDIEIFSIIFAPPLILSWLGVGGYSQFYRYRHARAEERQQIKWVVLALIVFAVLFIPFAVVNNLSGIGDPQKVGLINAFIFSMINVTIGNLIFMGIPVSIAFAMLRYRLWDVDVLIRRTLVYAALTVTLALVFFGGVTLLQRAFGALTGTSTSPAAIVISTLAIWVLFNPLRKRVQDFIDRRFYRKKYNAEQALKKFTELARSETDIEQLSAEIMAVVRETMQPEKVGLWLREAKK